MTATVTLQSRFPEIIATLPKRMEAAALTIAEEIASNARDNAQALYEGSDPFSIEAKATETGAAVVASYWYYFGEFGTTKQPARPFLIPAFESTRPLVTPIVAEWLRDL